jgi:ParB family chromosome partitioning protein
LNPLEAAEGYMRLGEEFHLSHEAIAEQVGKSRAAISNTLRLLKLAPAARQALAANRISEGHARALLGLPTAQAQGAALQTVLRGDLNVRQTEELVRRFAGERKAPCGAPAPSPPSVPQKRRRWKISSARPWGRASFSAAGAGAEA